MLNLTTQQKIQFSEIIDSLGESLDISESQYNAAVVSYQAVGEWLTNDDSLLKPYNPKIIPQGSLVIGTTIKPIHKDDDIDLDLVCQLSQKAPYWAQIDLKDIVGEQLEKHKTYESLLDEEGRRCWTLRYRENSKPTEKYHMDILPSITADGFSLILEKAFINLKEESSGNLAIRITDRELKNYKTETDPNNWLKSNPFGYAIWFINQATLTTEKRYQLNESLKPMPKYQSKKLPLQRVVQILKRHRDLMFSGKDDKPISVIITTLAGYAYRKETDILDALVNVVNSMENYIEDRFDFEKRRLVKYVANPVNDEENFADKWIDTPQKQESFYNWLAAVKRDLLHASQQRGQHFIMESLSKSFGDSAANETFTKIGNRNKILTEQGQNRFDAKVGLTAMGASTIKPHTFFGNE